MHLVMSKRPAMVWAASHNTQTWMRYIVPFRGWLASLSLHTLHVLLQRRPAWMVCLASICFDVMFLLSYCMQTIRMSDAIRHPGLLQQVVAHIFALCLPLLLGTALPAFSCYSLHSSLILWLVRVPMRMQLSTSSKRIRCQNQTMQMDDLHVSCLQVCVPLAPWAMRAGARETIYFNPKDTNVAIVTCGGLCPGLNDVVQGLVRKLEDYGVPEGNILGIRCAEHPLSLTAFSSALSVNLNVGLHDRAWDQLFRMHCHCVAVLF